MRTKARFNPWAHAHTCPLPIIPTAQVYVPMIPGTGIERMIAERIKPQTNGCWYWDGDGTTRGQIQWDGQSWAAYRLIYCMFHKLSHLPPRLHLHHQCQHPGCVNPDHLVSLTAEEHRAEHKLLRANCLGTRFGAPCNELATTHGRCLACHGMEVAARQRRLRYPTMRRNPKISGQ